MKTDPALYARISAFRIDHGSPDLTFVRRLARENAWTSAFAERVVREYLRFVYLACISPKPVTPSVAVDQAWHLHLCYTRSYWTDLCGDVLGRPLHHGPTQGGREEDDRYRDQYEHTLRLYASEFGQAPPRDIWPPSHLRFAPAANPFQVTRDRFIVIERNRFRTASVTAGAVLIARCSAWASMPPLQMFSSSSFLLPHWYSSSVGGRSAGRNIRVPAATVAEPAASSTRIPEPGTIRDAAEMREEGEIREVEGTQAAAAEDVGAGAADAVRDWRSCCFFHLANLRMLFIPLHVQTAEQVHT